jgi:TRAP transporter TAXI family solute receptor
MPISTVIRAAALAAATAALTAGAAQAQTLVMATDRVGSLFNATGAGLAKVATKHSGKRVIVKAFAGPDAYMTALNSGQYQFSAMSSITAWVEYNGKGGKRGAMKNLRIVRSGGSAIRLTFAVPAKSDIKAMADLKGKRVTYGFGGHAVIGMVTKGTLETAGLGWNDVTKVPVTGSVDAVEALGSGRVDASWAAFGMPILRKVHAQIGLRYLPIIDSPAARKHYRETVFPAMQFVTMKANPKLGIDKTMTFLSYDSYLVAHKDVDGATIAAVLKGLWDNTEELRKTHIGLRGFSHKTSVTDLPVLPYHPAAVAFYKEKGLWDKDAEMKNAAIK